MLADLSVTCVDCDTDLGSEAQQLTMRTPEGRRHAYECACGAITITVSK